MSSSRYDDILDEACDDTKVVGMFIILVMGFISGAGILVFMGSYMEYCIVRYDLSETQVRRILKDLPAALEGYWLPSDVEHLVKNASTSAPLLRMSMLVFFLPMIILGHIRMALEAGKWFTAFGCLLVLVTGACVIYKFSQVIKRERPDEPL